MVGVDVGPVGPGVDGITVAACVGVDPVFPDLRLSRLLTAFSMILVQSSSESGTLVMNT